MVEKRAVSLGGTGNIEQITSLVKEVQKATPLLQGIRYFYGNASNSTIPIYSPTVAKPDPYAEGSTGIPLDTTAALSTKSLTPNSFVSILPVTDNVLKLSSVNFESEISSIFSDAFAQEFHSQILTGDGTGLNFKGIFTTAAANSNKISVDPSLAALENLALQLRDYVDNGVIIMHPSFFQKVLSDAAGTSGEDILKEEMIRSMSVFGIKIILTTGAPSSTSTGAIWAVAGRLSNYGLAIASEIQIEHLRTVGSTLHYFQASAYANGSTILDKEWQGLAIAS
jgi:HK97 family phage major capsid protein